jgi:hypothetical protein
MRVVMTGTRFDDAKAGTLEHMIAHVLLCNTELRNVSIDLLAATTKAQYVWLCACMWTYLQEYIHT